MTDVTDIVRLEATALALLSFGLGIVEVASILVLDWACRSPELTATFLANMDEKKYDADAESTSAIEVYRQLSESKQWRSFWIHPLEKRRSFFGLGIFTKCTLIWSTLASL